MFYKGIVEAIDDPKKLGRVRVRVFGVHTNNKSDAGDKKNYLPVSDLPWASPMMPITSPAISGKGEFAIPALGSIVVIGFFDAEEMQEPFYLGTLAVTAEEKPDTSKGFSDPTGTNPSSAFLNRSPFSKRATGDNGITKSPIGNEPADAYAAEYPNNHVLETESGHVIEYDDTPGAERILLFHKVGAWIEIDPTGNIVAHASSGGKIYLTGKDDSDHSGVVTNHCICAFTGAPHPDWSQSVEASK